MLPPIEDQVVEFFDALFERIFSERFRPRITQRIKRNAVLRQVQEAADAASQSLTRFLLNEQRTKQQTADTLEGLTTLTDRLTLDDIDNPNETPEAVVDTLLAEGAPGDTDAVFRTSLHSVVQVLMLVGPVMAEWQKLSFASTFELPRRVVNRLNQISELLEALGHSGQAVADERYELTYRDYLLQRFHRVEAGTVRMTTNMQVDLRELFVMPRVKERPRPKGKDGAEPADATAFMDLAAARELFKDRDEPGEEEAKEDDGTRTALDQVKQNPRNVIVGAPGSGKSTFFEWLQVQVAGVEEELVLAGQQAIPLLLRLRQLDPHNLPRGAALVEKATASKDRTALMPLGWLDRQMKAGRVLFMLDGLDETEPDLRDNHVLPWLLQLCRKYPKCHFLVSSRPVGYPPGTLRKLKFVECDLLDFEMPQISDYTKNWCTAVRLARNEPEEEARREGAADGKQIVDGFKDQPYIRNLARNPLMLSAVCLVNYFEGGTLPDDRAVLYKLCVEGLLHNWDQRRGIHSDFPFDEKLRACREVALAMQADDRAEYEADKVKAIFADVLGDPARAENLLEHVRYRTGLLLERRPEVFAFAHLTFQEYLAARAVHEGNRVGVDVDLLAREHADGRWQEVIALYCGLTPAPAARGLIELLIHQPDTESLSTVLAEAYLSSGSEVLQDRGFRKTVLERIAIAPALGRPGNYALDRFPIEEVAPIATRSICKIESDISLSEAHQWLVRHPRVEDVNFKELLRTWQEMSTMQVTELIHLSHRSGSDEVLLEMTTIPDIYAAPGPKFGEFEDYATLAEIAFIGLAGREIEVASGSPGFEAALLKTLLRIPNQEKFSLFFPHFVDTLLKNLLTNSWKPQDIAARLEFASLARRLARRLAQRREEMEADPSTLYGPEEATNNLTTWADHLEESTQASDEKPDEGKAS